MNRLFPIFLFLLALLLPSLSRSAETFLLSDGTSITGEILSADDSGLRLRLPDESYSDRIPWTKFSQADLLRLLKNPKIEPFVAPFIEISEARRTEPRPIGPLKEPDRLPRPTGESIFGSLFHSPLGWALLLAMYAANIYAGLEVAVYRAQPRGLVCGAAAVLPIIGPAIFLAMPTRIEPEEPGSVVRAVAEDVPVVNPMQADVPAAQHSSLHIQSETATVPSAAPELPPPEVFTRGQFTFNRRFFETRFPKFFGVHHGADKDKVIVIKSARRDYVTDRIVRVTAGEVVVQITHGTASEEVIIPYLEISEVILRHRNATSA